MTVTYHVGDSRAVIASIPDGSVDLIASSPPFLALRSYLPAGHEAKGDEIGSEANPAAFLDTLLALTAEWGRVLAPHGSLAIELGDTYSGDDRRNGEVVDVKTPHRQAIGRPQSSRANTGLHWPLAKSLALIPQLYAVALAYGINPLTGQPSPAGRWRVRNVIVWHRPNPAVGALGDKVRPSTSYIVVATRSAKRWFDLTSVRTPSNTKGGTTTIGDRGSHDEAKRNRICKTGSDPAGAPPLDAWFDPYDGTHDTWTLTTQPSSLAHYAMWPAKLAERLILMMCPREVCRVCGEPRRRVERGTRDMEYRQRQGCYNDNTIEGGTFLSAGQTTYETLGWTDCGCVVNWLERPVERAFRPGIVLDPFCGTSTTMCVAELHGRDSIGIDLDPRNRDLMPRRMEECKRALFGTQPEMPGQLGIFDEVPA